MHITKDALVNGKYYKNAFTKSLLLLMYYHFQPMLIILSSYLGSDIRSICFAKFLLNLDIKSF